MHWRRKPKVIFSFSSGFFIHLNKSQDGCATQLWWLKRWSRWLRCFVLIQNTDKMKPLIVWKGSAYYSLVSTVPKKWFREWTMTGRAHNTYTFAYYADKTRLLTLCGTQKVSRWFFALKLMRIIKFRRIPSSSFRTCLSFFTDLSPPKTLVHRLKNVCTDKFYKNHNYFQLHDSHEASIRSLCRGGKQQRGDSFLW